MVLVIDVNKKEISLISYYAGEILIKEGEFPKDNAFYIIAQGSVDVLQGEEHIATLGVGQQIGEMALFGNNEGKRNATIRAFTGIKLLKIHESAYKKFINKISRAYFRYSADYSGSYYGRYRVLIAFTAFQESFKSLCHGSCKTQVRCTEYI